jgi:GMP synthase-like glutamine amidotransferase
MKLCILDNDHLDPQAQPRWHSYGVMTERLLRAAGFVGDIDIFVARDGLFPTDWSVYDAVVLTGSRADAFGDDPWVQTLRAHITGLLSGPQRLIGICFGHQLIAHCLGAPVGRSPKGWGVGLQRYDWLGASPLTDEHAQVAFLASHQDQVLALPEGATLLASNAHCPVAAYAVGETVLCIQPHPEFDSDYSAYLLDTRRERFGEDLYQQATAKLKPEHDGVAFARYALAFIGSKP